VVGWSIDASQTAALVTNALGMAIEGRSPAPGTIVHADHGRQFTSWAFTSRLRDSGLLASMGTVGDGLDNAVAEAFWARMQVELLNRSKWRTRVELANAMFEYLEVFHNRQRRHSALGMRTPVEYEILHQTPSARGVVIPESRVHASGVRPNGVRRSGATPSAMPAPCGRASGAGARGRSSGKPHTPEPRASGTVRKLVWGPATRGPERSPMPGGLPETEGSPQGRRA
jgi:putative transposase